MPIIGAQPLPKQGYGESPAVRLRQLQGPLRVQAGWKRPEISVLAIPPWASGHMHRISARTNLLKTPIRTTRAKFLISALPALTAILRQWAVIPDLNLDECIRSP